MRPRAWRLSGTRRRILIDGGVNIFPEFPERDAWRTREGGKGRFDRYERPPTQGDQLANGHAVARNDEGFPAVECAHDSSAFVAKLPLSNLPAHAVRM